MSAETQPFLTPGGGGDGIPPAYHVAIDIDSHSKVATHAPPLPTGRTENVAPDFITTFFPFCRWLFGWRARSDSRCARSAVVLGICVFFPLALAADVCWLVLRIAIGLLCLWIVLMK
jgi:hypothetical protein